MLICVDSALCFAHEVNGCWQGIATTTLALRDVEDQELDLPGRVETLATILR